MFLYKVVLPAEVWCCICCINACSCSGHCKQSLQGPPVIIVQHSVLLSAACGELCVSIDQCEAVMLAQGQAHSRVGYPASALSLCNLCGTKAVAGRPATPAAGFGALLPAVHLDAAQLGCVYNQWPHVYSLKAAVHGQCSMLRRCCCSAHVQMQDRLVRTRLGMP